LSEVGSIAAGSALVAQLKLYGVEHVFCVPGESYLAVLNAFIDSGLTVTVCRHEGGAAMMADAFGRVTGRPGVAFVTRAPGAANAAVGVHIAFEDSTPLILFAGQVRREFQGRGAWQEMDIAGVFGAMSKWADEPQDASRLGEYVARAFHTASAGRPGPVVMGLPRDLLTEQVKPATPPPFRPLEIAPSARAIAAWTERLNAAKAPIAILGGSGWTQAARDRFATYAERHDLPVATSYRRISLFDSLHPAYAGDVGLGANPQLIQRIKAADLVLLLGGRLGEVASQGFSLLPVGADLPQLVHVYPDPEELGRLYSAGLQICASPVAFVDALDEGAPRTLERGRMDAAHAAYLAWSEGPTPQTGAVNLSEIMIWLRSNLPTNAFICNGAGGYASWIHRFFRFRSFASHVAPTSATMGYGVPAAVAMQRLFPDRCVVAIAGDGDFLMNGQEFATAVQYDLPILVIVLDNGSYGSIRMSQEQAYPGRVSATDLRNPDFAAYARAFGGFGATVETTKDFAAAFLEARASGRPSILHVKYDVDSLTPSMTISGLRRAAGVD